MAIVIPEEQWAKQWANQNDCSDVSLAELCENAKLKKEIEAEITRLSNENKLSSLERPKGVHLSSVLFSVENDTLTPTFKLKRHQAVKVYKSQIDNMYERIVAAELSRD